LQSPASTAILALCGTYASRDTAVGIYKQDYFDALSSIDKVLSIYERVAAEVFDTGVNMGPKQAIIFLQVALNVLNQQGKQYQDITVDGAIGPRTLAVTTSL
jgi:lysozyme family protein